MDEKRKYQIRKLKINITKTQFNNLKIIPTIKYCKII